MTDNYDPRDTRIDKKDELKAMLLISSRRKDLLCLKDHVNRAPYPESASILWCADAWVEECQASKLAKRWLQIAYDNLFLVSTTCAPPKRALRPYAWYSMIRTALEVSAHGTWLLDGGDSREIAVRALGVFNKDLDDVRKYNVADHGEWQNRGAYMDALAKDQERVGLAPHPKLDATSALKQFDRRFPVGKTRIWDLVSAEIAWRSCCFFAHGNITGTDLLLERHPDGELGEPAVMTSSYTVLANLYCKALHMTLVLLDEYEKACKGPPVDL